MLNTVTFDADDLELIKNSYKAIKRREYLTIVTDETEFEKVNQAIVTSLSIPHTATFSIQNIFRMKTLNNEFYIVQCLFDFGYPVSAKLMQSSIHKYQYQLVGVATTTVDLGKTIIRRETKLDKAVSRIFDSDIDIDGFEKFSDKYFLVSNRKDELLNAFDRKFLNTIGKYNDVILVTKSMRMFIGFQTEMKVSHSRAVEDIFAGFSYLAKSF